MTYMCKTNKEETRIRIRDITGNCLEKLGIKNFNGGYAIIDKNAEVCVGDVVHCTKIAGGCSTYLKQVKAIDNGTVIVGTAYLDNSKDYTFEAAEILGVVLETYGKFSGLREYSRNTNFTEKNNQNLAPTKKVTNREFLSTLTDQEFAEWVLFYASDIGRQSIQSVTFLGDWLNKEYDGWINMQQYSEKLNNMF